MNHIDRTPHITYQEAESNPNWTGEGAYIPVFIGLTGNKIEVESKMEDVPISIKKYKTYSGLRKSVELGGIGTDEDTNPLLATLKDFFEEAAKQTSNDISIPYIYVIDMGGRTLSDLDSWERAFALAKTKRDARVEVVCGFNVKDSKLDVATILGMANTSIVEDSKTGIPRTLFTTILDAEDEELIEYTNDETKVDGKDAYVQYSRIGITEPTMWGKIVAKMCITPYYEEPGYTVFRSIKSGIFDKRTDEEQQTLQNAGIIFIRDELADSTIYPKICLAVSTSFAKLPETRPHDCLFHSRRNVDNLITRVYDACYSQLKRNETKVNLSHLQTDIDVIVDDEIDKGYMMSGTKCIVSESETNPYNIEVDGNAIPVNSSLYILFGMYVSNPNIQVTDESI